MGGAVDGGTDFGRSRNAHRPDPVAAVLRGGDGDRLAGRALGKGGRGLPQLASQPGEPREQRFAHQRIGKVHPGAVAAAGEYVARQRDRRVALRLGGGEFADRVDHQRADRHIGIGHPVDERAVGPVLEQPAHQIGQQILVRSDRRINPHPRRRASRLALGAGEFFVNILAHAVEALEFERAACSERGDRADCIGVVRGKGREQRIARIEQPRGTGEVRHIGCHLAGEHRVIGIAADLAQLDLGVPIRALDQPDEQLAAMPAGERHDPVAERDGALLIGLDGEAEAFPVSAVSAGEQAVIGDQRLNDVEREFEPLGLFGVDREMNIGIARPLGQRAEHRHQRRLRRIGVIDIVFGIERRQLYRNAGRGM